MCQSTLGGIFSLSQSALLKGLYSEPEYSGRGICICPRVLFARVLWERERDLGLVLWERDLGLSHSTLAERFGPEPEYLGREI